MQLHPTWFSVGDCRVRLLRDGSEAFPALLEAIAVAAREVLVEMYWVGDDDVGSRFRDALADRARAGVTVRVIYDAVGSLGLAATFWQPLREAGGEVHEYHPLSPSHRAFDLFRVAQRDHRKLVVIDSERGFTGGINLAEPWSPGPPHRGWRDDMIEVRGHVAEELRTLFYKTWRHEVHAGLLEQWHETRLPRDLLPLRKHPHERVYVLATQRSRKRSLRREYLARLNKARRSIDIANSYFLPDRRVRNALYRAVKRGVEVRVLVPSKSDVAVVQFALESLVETMLSRGIHIYRYQGRMMHAKTLVIDESFVLVGSYNLDEQSRSKNLEVSIAVDDAPFATYVRTWFNHDLCSSHELHLDIWRQRPVWYRAVETAAYALRKVL